MDALCLAFETEERGVFISGGRPWLERELVEAVGGNVDSASKSISELLRKGVLKVREDGAIYSAKMVRDEEIRVKRSNGGKFGGNPALKKKEVNLPDNLLLNLNPNLLSEYDPEGDLVASGKGEHEGGDGPPKPPIPTDSIGLTFPQVLRTQKFMETWNAWVQHRYAMGACKDFVRMFQKQLEWLGTFPEPTACAMLDQSLRFGWQGIFDVKTTGAQQHHSGNGTVEKKQLSVHELRTIAQAKEGKAADLKRRHCSEVAAGEAWSDLEKRKEYFKLRKEIREINNRISSFA